MTAAGWLQLLVLVVLLAVSIPILGNYMAKVFGGKKAPGDRVFNPVERVIYRLGGIDPDREQKWSTYALALLAFSLLSVLMLFVLQRVQEHLPLNPTHVKGVPSFLAFNTAVSFLTNTNWQNYAGESTMSHLTQMAGLAVQNFASAAVGMVVAVALIRGFTRLRTDRVGNFWVDLVRGCLRILLPLAIVGTILLVALGAVQNLTAGTSVTTLAGIHQSITGGPLVSLYTLTTPLLVLAGTGLAMSLSGPKTSILNPGPHGLSEVLYAFMSAANNNGSAFAGLSVNTDFYNRVLGVVMLTGRFIPILLVLALAGSLARQALVPPTAGTLPTHRPMFVGMLVGVVTEHGQGRTLGFLGEPRVNVLELNISLDDAAKG